MHMVSRQRTPVWVAAVLSVFLLTTPPTRADDATGDLSLSVVVVDELTPRPVPFTDFKLTPESGSGQEQIVRTDEHGVVGVKLAPGRYVLETVHVVAFKGHNLTWKTTCTVQASQTCQLRLTDADASQVTGTPARQVSDEAKVYQDLKPGVVTVECDFGHGSGFVVDKRGLVLTNQHVVNGTHWAAIRFDRGIRVNANVIQEDKDADVAVLQFNPEAFKDFRVIPLADTAHGPVAVEGEKVLTIGSPLHEEKILTTGIVSKIQGSVLMSNVNINPGNSGGPLLNLAGEAVGLTTFIEGPGRGGPGISGVVSICKASGVLESAKQKLVNATPPTPDLLPDVSPTPIPNEAIAQAHLGVVKPVLLKAPHNFVTAIFTPFALASSQGERDRELARNKNLRAKRRSDKGLKEDYQVDPERFYDAQEAVVYVQVKPVLKETSGSQWRAAFGAALGVQTAHELRYRDDFYDMQLFRGDQPVQPVRRSRAQVDILQDSGYFVAKDCAFGGLYQFDPSAFEPSQPLTLKVRKESDLTKWAEVKIDPKLQRQIWDEFATYRESLAYARPSK